MGGRSYSWLACLVIAVVALSASACSSPITEEEAKAISMEFVKERVKFFARDANSTVDLPVYTFGSVFVEKKGDVYNVMLHVSASLGNETKEGDITATVNNKGEVINLKKGTN